MPEWTPDADPPDDWRQRLATGPPPPADERTRQRERIRAARSAALAGDPATPAQWRAAPEAMRDAYILRLRVAGHTLEEIAARVGYAAPSTIARRIEHAYAATVRQPADIARDLALRRLDAILACLWPHLDSDRPTVFAAVDRILKVLERHARLLGLDAPARCEVTTMDHVDAEIERLCRHLADTGFDTGDLARILAVRDAGTETQEDP